MSSIGERLASLRKAKGLSVRELAKKSGISDTMLRHIERDEMLPGYKVLSDLAEGLAVQKNWLFFGDLVDVQIQVAPEFVPTELSAKYRASTVGPDRVVPEPAKYLDPDGCAAYLALVSEPSYKVALEGAPLRELSDAVREAAGLGPLSLVCLGSGHARYEDRFLSLILSRSNLLNVVCVDISSSLLILGGRRICNTLQTHPSVSSSFVYGDFLTLPWEIALRPDRRICITMFGYTYCNLQTDTFLDEIPLSRGDLVVLDIVLPVDPPENDPALHRSIEFQSRLFDFLVSPLAKIQRADQLTLRTEIVRGRRDYTHRIVATAASGEEYIVGIAKRIGLPHLAAMVAPKYSILTAYPYSEGLRAMVLLIRN